MTAHCRPLQEIALHTTAPTLGAYLDARRRVHEAQLAAEHNAQLAALREELGRRKVENDPVAPIRTAIVDDILTLRCPRAACRQAFLDFDGCLALQCRREGCGAHFCGICMAECATSRDAHLHAQHCKYGNGTYYANGDAVARLQNEARKDKLRALLQPLAPQLAAAVLAQVRPELQGVGLQFGPEDLAAVA